MRVLTKLVAATTFVLILSIILPKISHASEGQFELANTVGDDSRCFAVSVLLSTNQYHVVVACRNLVYPSDDLNSKYVLWARSGTDIVRLGSLALGKVTFNTKVAFSQLFVTLETNEKVKEPGGRIVMRGNLQDILFLEQVTTPTPSVTSTNRTITITTSPEESQAPVAEETPTLTTREKLLIGLKRSSIIAAVALLGLIGLILVITRSRG